MLFFFSLYSFRCLRCVWHSSYRIIAREGSMCTRRVLPHPISKSTHSFWEITFEASFAANGVTSCKFHKFKHFFYKNQPPNEKEYRSFGYFFCNNSLSKIIKNLKISSPILGHSTIVLFAPRWQNSGRDTNPWHLAERWQLFLAVFNNDVTSGAINVQRIPKRYINRSGYEPPVKYRVDLQNGNFSS